MGIHIVIDGYNLIRQSSRLRALEHRDQQTGREALVDALAAYKRVKPHPITVVFDGTDAPTGMPRRDVHKGIKLFFSAPGETADDMIKRMAAREKDKLLVVTSDNDIIRCVESLGAATIGSQDFEERLIMARYMDLKGGADEDGHDSGWQPTTRKKGPSRRLTKRQRKIRRTLSKL